MTTHSIPAPVALNVFCSVGMATLTMVVSMISMNKPRTKMTATTHLYSNGSLRVIVRTSLRHQR